MSGDDASPDLDEDEDLDEEDEDLDDDEDDDDDGAAPWATSGGPSGAAAGGQVPSTGARGGGGPPTGAAQVSARPRGPTRSSARGGTGRTGSDVENVTRRVVDRFTCEGFMFTALDISNSVKASLAGVRHREVAPIVRDLFDEGAMSDDFRQTLIDVQTPDGKTVQAFLYHLDEDDPDDYAGTQRQQRAVPPVPVSTLMQGGGTPNEVTVEIGKDGRARIPRDFLERAGLTSGTVHAEPTGSPGALFLCEPADATVNAAATLGYSHPTLLYVPLTLLSGVGFDLTKPIKARIDGKGVRVEGS